MLFSNKRSGSLANAVQIYAAPQARKYVTTVKVTTLSVQSGSVTELEHFSSFTPHKKEWVPELNRIELGPDLIL